MSTRNNLSPSSGKEGFHISEKSRKLYVVYNKSGVLRINIIIAVDRTILAPASEVYRRPDNDFGWICAN